MDAFGLGKPLVIVFQKAPVFLIQRISRGLLTKAQKELLSDINEGLYSKGGRQCQPMISSVKNVKRNSPFSFPFPNTKKQNLDALNVKVSE